MSAVPTTPLPIDAAAVAIGRVRAGHGPDVAALLAELSHVDPDHRPLLHAHLWSRINQADVMRAD